MEGPQKMKYITIYDPAIQYLSIFQRKKILFWKHICTPMFIAALRKMTLMNIYTKYKPNHTYI